MLGNLLAPKRGVVDAVATTTFAETAKALAVGLTAVLAPGAPAVGAVMGAASKELVQAVLKQASSVEGKLDRLLRTPFAAGVQLLVEAAGHEVTTEKELDARDELCDDAHLMLRQAHAIAGDSRSDCAFITALDAMALAMRRGHQGAAERSLILAKHQIRELEAIADDLQARAMWIADLYAKAERIFGPRDLGDKPFGYAEQRAYLRWRENELEDAQEAVAAALGRLEVLAAVVSAAEAVLAHEGRMQKFAWASGTVTT